jgi:hypothetical protein
MNSEVWQDHEESTFKAARAALDPSFVPPVFCVFQFRVVQIRLCNRISMGSGSATQIPGIRSPEMSRVIFPALHQFRGPD